MNNGWIKLYRKTIECGFFNNPSLSHFWVWCLLKASHKEQQLSVKYQSVPLLPGQFVFGRKVASLETGLSERTIRTSVNHLKELGNVTIKSTNKFSILTICKWDTYQKLSTGDDQQNDLPTTNRRPTDDHIQEGKEVKNDNKLSGKGFKFDLRRVEKEYTDGKITLEKKNEIINELITIYNKQQ